MGASVVANLTSITLSAEIYLVNPAHETLLGRTCYPRIAALPNPVDLAVIVTPAASVPKVVLDCAHAGIRGAIVISAGFREIGETGRKLEAEIVANAGTTGMRVVGPNCLGVMTPSVGLNATFANVMARPGNLAFASQSGALGTAILDWSIAERVGFSHFVSLGSMADVGWADVIDYFGGDPQTEAIILYMESIGDAHAFLSAARAVAQSKPIIVIKGGRTGAAARAAISHTGSLVGSDDVVDAAFRRCGVLRVDTLSDLFAMAEALAKQPRPKGRNLAMITNAGGAGVLAVDALVHGGGQPSELSAESIDALSQFLPAHWSHANPVDILGDATPERYAKAASVCANDPAVNGLLVILAPQGVADANDVATSIIPLSHIPGKPVIAAWMGGTGVARGADTLRSSGVPTYAYPDTATRVFNYMWRYDDAVSALYETPALDDGSFTPDLATVSQLLADALGHGRGLLTEEESKRALAAYGIPVVQTILATSADEAVKAARALGFPLVVKLHSHIISHKSDVGGVRLNNRTEDDVRASFLDMQKAIQNRFGPESFSGVTVQPQIPAGGQELIVGSSIDDQFGPVMLFGLGGRLVEVFKDNALGLPPLNSTLARRMMERTQVYRALCGVRGSGAVDLTAIERVLVRFSRLVLDFPRIREFDINPLLASESGVTALDARARLWEASTTDAHLPRPAIRPYPAQYVFELRTRTGNELCVRPIRAEDEALVAAFHRRLSATTVYARYAGNLSLDLRVAHQRLARVCFIDFAREIALVAVSGQEGAQEIVAIGRLLCDRARQEAEFALVVQDDRQGDGIGTQLLSRLLETARAEGLRSVVGYVLSDNTAMLGICARLGFRTESNVQSERMLTLRYLL